MEYAYTPEPSAEIRGLSLSTTVNINLKSTLINALRNNSSLSDFDFFTIVFNAKTLQDFVDPLYNHVKDMKIEQPKPQKPVVKTQKNKNHPVRKTIAKKRKTPPSRHDYYIGAPGYNPAP